MNQTSIHTAQLPQILPPDSLKTNPHFDLLSPTSIDDPVFDSAFDPALDFQYSEASKEGGADMFNFEGVPQSSIATSSLDGGLVKAEMLENASANLPPTPDSDLQSSSSNGSQSPFSKQADQTMTKSDRGHNKQSSRQATSAKQDAKMTKSVAELSQKHKKQRKNSNDGQSDEAVQAASRETQKERSRAKNKIAAAKCRSKKRNHMDNIENDHRALSAENSLLKREEQQLRASVAQLRTLALDHQNCNCGVHQYNMFEAKKLAHGIGSMQSSGMDHPCRYDYRTMSMPVNPVASSEYNPRPRSQSFVAQHSHLAEAQDGDHMFDMEEPLFEENNFYDLDSGMTA